MLPSGGNGSATTARLVRTTAMVVAASQRPPRPPREQRRSFHVLASSPTLSSLQQKLLTTGTGAIASSLVVPGQHQQQQQPSHRIVLRRWFESEAVYHKVADETLEGLQDAVEYELESLDDAPDDMDVSLASGVLTIYLPPHGTWVLNKQTPNRQIWWSSPLSGPKRFEYTEDGNLWFATQNGLSLVPLLAQELSHVMKTDIHLNVDGTF